MNIEKITDKEAICIITLFIMGSTLILGIGGETKNDAWITAIVGMLFSIPFYFVYSRILSIFPGKDLFEILDLVFGRYIGKFVALLYIVYAFHLGALVTRNFGEFVSTLGMPETPIFVALLTVGIVCIVGVRLGTEVIGRTCAYLIIVVFAIIVFVQVLAIPQMHFNYIKPVFYTPLPKIIRGAFSVFSFPFAETVVLMGTFSALKSKKSPYKVYFTGLFLAGFIIVFVTMRNIFLLGKSFWLFYFPSYMAVSQIEIGRFIQRIEVAVSFVFAVAAFTKISICLHTACKGIGRVFGLKDYRPLTINVGLLMIYFSFIVFDNIMDMSYSAFNVYPYFAFPFQAVIPLILWIGAEIKRKKDSKNKCIS